MTLKRTMCALLAATMLLPTAIMAETSAAAAEVDVAESAAQLTEESSEAGSYGLADNIQDGVIFHAFCWKYSDIQAMLPDIAKAGFTSVQTSPPQATDGTGSWWWFYQPKGFYIGSGAMGTKQDLTNLCSEAEKYGIKIIADVVANHLAGNHDNIQNDLKDSQYWHPDIGDAKDGNRNSVTHGKIGMPDLNTEHSYVQQCVYNYVQELKSVGVDGIRFDAAKHIGLPSEGDQFWPNVTKDTSLWYYGEILNNPGLSFEESSGQRSQAIAIMKEYTNYMTVTDSPYGMTLREAFNSGTAPSAFGNYCAEWMGLANNKLLYWGESHDTWSNNKDWGYSNEMSQNVIDRAYAVAASRNQVTALYFSRPSTAVKDDITIGEKGSTHFTASEVAAVNKFHNAMIGKADYFVNSNGCAVITRKDGGAVIVKGSGSGQVSVTNGGGYAKPGTYKDAVSGSTFTVTSTTISGNIGSSGIAVIYDDVPSSGISASPDSGTSFTDTLTVTLYAANVKSASYTTSEGASGTYTDGKTITIGGSTAEGSKVTLTLTGTASDGSALSPVTYTYTKKGGYPILEGAGFVFDNSATNWSTVNAYVYDESGSSVISNSQWPGVKMTDCGNGYWKYDLDSKFSGSNIRVIFNNGSDQIPASQQPGYQMSSSDKKLYENSTWQELPDDSSIEVSLKSSSSSVTLGESVTLTATATGASGTVNYTFSDGSNTIQSSTKNTAAWTPVAAGTYTVTVTAEDSKGSASDSTTVKVNPSTGPIVNVDKASGTSFTSETMSLKLTLANATKGTYSVDGGPVKEFTGSKTISIGEGKIGDSTVKVETTATNGSTTKSYTYTYKKVYQKKTSASSGSSSKVTAASTAASGTETSGSAALGGKYATNPNKQYGGKGVTITSASDFKDSMIIAQGVANDDPRIFRGSHEAPVYDSYALYSAWDDTNLYLGWQFTNVTDVVDPAQGYPISDNGKPWNGDIPQMIAFDLGKGKFSDMSKGTLANGYVWGLKVGFQTRIDALMCFSSKPGVGQPALFKTDSTGYFNYDEVTSFTAGGISFKYQDGFFGSSLIGIKANGYEGYKPADLTSSSSNWVDFLSTSHDKNQDTFYYMTIPLNTLGITRSYIENHGIGVMHISTFGEGGIACTPMDMTMLDKATEPYSQDESSSAEKEDVDTITVPLARIGAADTDTDYDDSDSDSDTDTDSDTLPLQVNFGTNKSAPQLAATALTLKGIGYGGTAPYKYQFSVDGSVVKASNTTATYTWTPTTAGSHTIKCVITDATGKTATVSKTFTAEGDSPVTALTNNTKINSTSITLGDTVTLTGGASGGTGSYKYVFYYKRSTASDWTTIGTAYGTATTASFKPLAAVSYDVKVNVKDSAGTIKPKTFTVNVTNATLTNSSKVSTTNLTRGNTLAITGAATGGTSPYKYAFYYKRSTATAWTTIGTAYGTATTASLKPLAAVSYDVKVIVKDNAGKTATKTFTVNVTNATLTNSSKVSTTNLTLGNTLAITGAATGGTSPYKYAFYYKRSTATAWTTIGTAYGTATTASLKPLAAVNYDVKVIVKDNAGKTATKTFTIAVTSATLTNKSSISATTINLGDTLKLTGAATGGTGSYKYAYYCKRSTATAWTTIGTEFGTATTASVKPTSAVTYDIKIVVKDSANKTATKTFTLTVASTTLTNSSKVSSTTLNLGNTLTITGAALGGTSPYKYAFYYKRSTATAWTTIGTAYGTATTTSFKPSAAVSYDVKVIVKDNAGKTATKTFTVNVVSTALTNKSSISATSLKLGDTLKITGAATGGSGSYLYAYYCKRSTATSWTVLGTEYGTVATASVKLTSAVNYDILVSIKDKTTGEIVTKQFTVKVTS